MRSLLATLTLSLSLSLPSFFVLPLAAQQEGITKQYQQSQAVYITRTGKKYHRDGCSYLRQSKIEISLKDAKARGYTACSRCNPPK